MRLYRPHIPLEVQSLVASRQLGYNREAALYLIKDAKHQKGGVGALLRKQIRELKGRLGANIQLDHDPALENRQFDPVTRKYTPDANDPDYLIYREKHAHYIKTHVRGDGAKRSDTAERNHQKRMDENRGLRARKPKVKIRSRGFQSAPGKPTKFGRQKFTTWRKRKMGRKSWR